MSFKNKLKRLFFRGCNFTKSNKEIIKTRILNFIYQIIRDASCKINTLKR